MAWYNSLWNGIKDAEHYAEDGVSSFINSGWNGFISNGISSGWNSLTDTLGLTDSKSSERAAAAATRGVNSANTQYDSDLAPVESSFQDAMTRTDANGNTSDRTLESNLNDYDTAMSGTNNALSSDNIASYLNPEASQIEQAAGQAAEGSAGSALQSSATNRDVASAVSNATSNLWRQAASEALADSQNNQQVANSTLQNDNIATLNWDQIEADKAAQKYAGQIGVTEANVDAAGTKNTLL